MQLVFAISTPFLGLGSFAIFAILLKQITGWCEEGPLLSRCYRTQRGLALAKKMLWPPNWLRKPTCVCHACPGVDAFLNMGFLWVPGVVLARQLGCDCLPFYSCFFPLNSVLRSGT